MSNVAIDLFCGIGGMSQGLLNAGFDVELGVEIDKEVANIYESNQLSKAVLNGDLYEVDPLSLLRDYSIESIDLLAGCPPCQDYSTMKTLNGKRQPDSSQATLTHRFAEFVKLLKPKSVLLENVPNLSKAPEFDYLLSVLYEMNYSIEYGVYNAKNFGVPQSRRRLILRASSQNKLVPLKPLCAPMATVRTAIGHLQSPNFSNDMLHNIPRKHSKRFYEMISYVPSNGGSRDAIPNSLKLECHKKTDGFKDVYGRMAWDRPSPTITGGCTNPSKGRFLHPEENRAISVREALLLQSFPENWRMPAGLGITKLSQLVGNAFPPLLAEAFARSLRD